MKISMYAKFQILNENLTPLTKEDVDSLSIGGYYFIINGKEIPFDWDAFSGDEEDSIFEFDTGYGFLFNDFELSDCYDEDYEKLDITREEITAEFLASVERIEEFHINFINANDDEVDLGYNDDEEYTIKLVEIIFTDLITEKEYKVKQEVLDGYNTKYEETNWSTESTPCDYGECPYGAEGGYDCRNYCGRGVDEDSEDTYYKNESEE